MLSCALRIVVCAGLLAATALPLGAKARAVDGRSVAAPVRLVPNGRAPIAVEGLGSYLGDIEVDSQTDGLVVANRLPLERYLLGLNEVPLEWPVEALRAQAVAARTYALWTLARPRAGTAAAYDFDICASDQCQVYSGAAVGNASHGERWRDAVETTAGEVLLYKGRPILARYHSTSGGRTLDNSDAFPGEADLPYLQSVSSRTEAGAPLYRWRVVFRRRHLERILRSAGWWSRAGRLTSVTTAPSRTGLPYPDVLFEGTRASVRRTVEDVRSLLRDLAPKLFPLLYPSPAPTSSGRLPETLPSNRVSISTVAGEVVVSGRGWGHGAGMSQWGAHGMARQGATYEAILAHYYRGAELARRPRRRPIEVGLAWGRESARASGSFRVIDGRGRTVVSQALGTWRFTWDEPGRVRMEAPAGTARPLRIDIVEAPARAAAGQRATLTITLSRPARVRALARDTGAPLPSTSEVRDAGRQRIGWVAPEQPGTYHVTVRAAASGSVAASAPVEIVVEPVSAVERDQAGGARDAGSFPAISALLAGVVALVVVVLASRLAG